MTSAATLVAWAYDATAKAYNPERIDWLTQQRDSLVATQFGGGKAVASLINAAGAGKTVGFQIDLPGPQKLQVISDALEMMGCIPAVAASVTTTFATFPEIER